MPYRRIATRSSRALETPSLECRTFAAPPRPATRSESILAMLVAAAPVAPVAISTTILLDSIVMGLICGGLAFVTAAPLTTRVVTG
jgi:hypothetical protein